MTTYVTQETLDQLARDEYEVNRMANDAANRSIHGGSKLSAREKRNRWNRNYYASLLAYGGHLLPGTPGAKAIGGWLDELCS